VFRIMSTSRSLLISMGNGNSHWSKIFGVVLLVLPLETLISGCLVNVGLDFRLIELESDVIDSVLLVRSMSQIAQPIPHREGL
jgi:hypothetical protein